MECPNGGDRDRRQGLSVTLDLRAGEVSAFADAVHRPKAGHASNVYYPLFDIARLVLAATVAAKHAGFAMPTYAGSLAVEVFFALSGWLIGGVLYDSARADAPRFFFNRITRIWIPYAVAIALLFGAALLKRPADFHWFEYLIHDATFTHNLFITPRDGLIRNDLPLEGAGNHFWSLAVEEQFYLVAPLIILFAPFGRSLRVWAALAATAWIAGAYASIAFGVLAAFTHKRFGDWRLRSAAQIATAAALVASGVAVLGFEWRFDQTAPIFAVSAVLLLARAGRRSRIGEWLGGVSYPFYLNHWIGLYAAHGLARAAIMPEAWRPLASLAIGLAVSAALYRLIDVEVRRRKAAHYSPGVGRVSVALAYGSIAFGLFFGLLLAALRG